MNNEQNKKFQPEKPITLCGMMGAGKSAIGRHLALIADLEFVDLDKVITQKENRSISEIFAEQGETYFRQTEREVLQSLWQKADRVIALGGGALQDREFASRIQQNTLLIYLKAPVQVLMDRLKGRTHRPLLYNSDGSMKSEEELEIFLNELAAKRDPEYQKAHIHFEVNNESDQKSTANRLWLKILEHEKQS